MAKYQEIRANFNQDTITVYQAYSKKIALPAIKKQKFCPPFSFNRMTWIKPSFLWLMARSNWGNKTNQECILAIKLSKPYWEKALSMGVLTNPDKNIYKTGDIWEKEFLNSKIHIQWDPERNIRNNKLEIRTIQVGVSRHLIEEFNEEWIKEIVDVTPLVKKINHLKKNGKLKEAKRLLPLERVYNVSLEIQKNIGISNKVS